MAPLAAAAPPLPVPLPPGLAVVAPRPLPPGLRQGRAKAERGRAGGSKAQRQAGGACALRQAERPRSAGLAAGCCLPAAAAALAADLGDGAGAAAADGGGGLLAAAATVGVAALAGAVGYGLVYFRMQYITAAMLQAHVPRGGARVLELGVGGGRNLYYYPSDTQLVVGVDAAAKPALLEQTALAAGVPVQVVAKPLTELDGLLAGSMDAAVAVFSLDALSPDDLQAVLRGAATALKPMKPLIFISARDGVREAIAASSDFEGVSYEVVLAPLWPRTVGLAYRAPTAGGGVGVGVAGVGVGAAGNRRKSKPK